MKALVYFQPSKKSVNFEGTRLRKTIKNALELVDIEYTSSVVDNFDIIHLISPLDEDKISVAHELNIPVIASALNTEDDPSASYLEYKNKDGKISVELSSKALKFLNKCDIVVVPCDYAKELLLQSGVTSEIRIAFPGVNIARFDFSRIDEKDIFYRYFSEKTDKRLVVAIGDYEGNLDGINALINAAKKCNNAIFYYIGHTLSMANLSNSAKKIIKTAPKNLHFVGSVPDDVYRSALLNASVFFLPGYKTASIVSLAEAMIAKCQLIVRKQAIYPGILTDGVNAYVAEYSETLASLCKDYLDGNIKPTYEESHMLATTYNLEAFGEQLKWIYQEQINLK